MSYGWLADTLFDLPETAKLSVNEATDYVFARLSDDAIREAAHSYVWLHLDKLARTEARRQQSIANTRLTQIGRAKAKNAGYDTMAQMRGARLRLGAFAELLLTEFALGNGRRVTWGDATVEDHEVRMAYMTAKIVGMSEDIDLHQKAIDLLHDAHAKSLREVAA